jgi:hypothetical protein
VSLCSAPRLSLALSFARSLARSEHISLDRAFRLHSSLGCLRLIGRALIISGSHCYVTLAAASLWRLVPSQPRKESPREGLASGRRCDNFRAPSRAYPAHDPAHAPTYIRIYGPRVSRERRTLVARVITEYFTFPSVEYRIEHTTCARVSCTRSHFAIPNRAPRSGARRTLRRGARGVTGNEFALAAAV